jgi:hypothetical protein
MSDQDENHKQLKDIMAHYRALLMDEFHLELGETPRWKQIRTRVLRLLSPDRGLEMRLRDLIDGGKGLERDNSRK